MKQKKIALTLLPVFWPNLPPLSLPTLKGYLAGKGIKTDCIDYNNFFYNRATQDLQKEWLVSCNRPLEEKIIDILQDDYPGHFEGMLKRLRGYDVVCFSCYKSNMKATRRIASMLKLQKPEIKIVLGGPEITCQYLEKKAKIGHFYGDIADFLAVGEGETPLFQYLSETGQIGPLAAFMELSDPRELPVPDYTDLDFSDYPRRSAVPMMTSRGCVRNCSFCSEKLLYKKLRVYPAQRIVEQIRSHLSKGVRQFIFHDSLINADLKALEELCDGIIRNFDSIDWEAQIAIRPDMPGRLFEKMKKSGCYHLFVGLESGCDDTLSNMNKGFTTKEAVEFFQELDFYDLSFGVSIIVGFPGETESDLMESLDFVIQHQDLIPKIEQVNPFVHYRGVDLPPEADYKNCEKTLDRTAFFIDQIKTAGFKYTRAFLMNLVETPWR